MPSPPWPVESCRWLLPASPPVGQVGLASAGGGGTGPRSAGASHHRSSGTAWRLVSAASWPVASHWCQVSSSPRLGGSHRRLMSAAAQPGASPWSWSSSSMRPAAPHWCLVPAAGRPGAWQRCLGPPAARPGASYWCLLISSARPASRWLRSPQLAMPESWTAGLARGHFRQHSRLSRSRWPRLPLHAAAAPTSNHRARKALAPTSPRPVMPPWYLASSSKCQGASHWRLVPSSSRSRLLRWSPVPATTRLGASRWRLASTPSRPAVTPHWCPAHSSKRLGASRRGASHRSLVSAASWPVAPRRHRVASSSRPAALPWRSVDGAVVAATGGDGPPSPRQWKSPWCHRQCGRCLRARTGGRRTRRVPNSSSSAGARGGSSEPARAGACRRGEGRRLLGHPAKTPRAPGHRVRAKCRRWDSSGPRRERVLPAPAVGDPLHEGALPARGVPRDVALPTREVRTPRHRHRRPPCSLSSRRPRARTARRFRTPGGAPARCARGAPRQLRSACG